MKYYLKLGIILLIIAATASGILAYINNFTRPIIDKNREEQKAQARKEVLPQAATFDSIMTLNSENVYRGKNDEGKTIGYTMVAALYGYSSNVKTMVGLNSDLQINKIKVIDQKETPGLGANCEQDAFQKQFMGFFLDSLKVDKDGGKIESITGATITSRAVTNSIEKGILTLEKSLSVGKEESIK